MNEQGLPIDAERAVQAASDTPTQLPAAIDLEKLADKVYQLMREEARLALARGARTTQPWRR